MRMRMRMRIRMRMRKKQITRMSVLNLHHSSNINEVIRDNFRSFFTKRFTDKKSQNANKRLSLINNIKSK